MKTRLRQLIALFLVGAALGNPASGQLSRQERRPIGTDLQGRPSTREIAHVESFARLYGVVRYFYPSDAAARLDWDRFAIHGVRQARAAADAKALERTLAALFSALGSGLVIGQRLPPPVEELRADAWLVAWRYLGPGITAAASSSSPYQAKRTNRLASAGGAPQGHEFLSRSPRSAPAATAELFAGATPFSGTHVEIDLGAGLRARVPLALSEADAVGDVPSSDALEQLRSTLAKIGHAGNPRDLDTRLADVVVAWNVFRHFYPYWPEAGVDWDQRLRAHLELSYAARTPDAQRNALRQLVADIRDGHGNVTAATDTTPRMFLPIRLARIGNDVVVTASDVPTDVPVGAVVSTIGGVPSTRRLEEVMRLVSGSTQWKQARALQEITTCEPGGVVALTLDRWTGSRAANVGCEATRVPAEKRPPPISELKPGTWYVDLTRAPMTDLTPVLERLARDAGVIFDVRGYPTDAGARVLPHLIDERERDRWMHVAKITGPFGRTAGWSSVGWNLTPLAPRFTGTIVFLTDGRAISYAESVMGYVADRKLGTIIGSPTAGANGNVVTFAVPSGFTIRFTGMRVTRHDGRTPLHLVGVQPDILLSPTLAGIRNGRDEMLERAVALIARQ